VPTGTRAAGQPDPPVRPAAKAGTAGVAFTLPVEVQAGSVALCGQFNDWRADSIGLECGSDGCWRATVPLERRGYRYRYLLDGERRKNARQAGRHVGVSSRS
jgi:1,4-alpha-glucan branching enzyme